jgi:uncharacterized protein YbaP (TraB family)
MRIRAREEPMILLRLILLALLTFLGSAWAKDTVCPGQSLIAVIEKTRLDAWNAALADFEKIPNNTGLFWRIEKDGIAPSWLLGTIHVPGPGLTDFRPAIRSAFGQSDRLVLESSEIFGAGQLQLAAEVAKLARYPDDNQSFDATFTEEEKEALGTMTAAVGMPYFVARHFKPWFLALSLAIPPCTQLAVMQGELGVDAALREAAIADGKPVIGLETKDEQIDAIKSLEQAGVGSEQLRQIATLGPKAIEDQIATQIALYLEERPALIVSLGLHLPEFNMDAEDFPKVETLLIHDRNLRFHDRLRPLLEQGGTFVAVGAMHLVGKVGLIELLRASGYAVTRVF